MKPNVIPFAVLIFLTGTYSCITPKEARQLKKTTKDWRESPIVLYAYADSPLAGAFLKLRDNKKFEHTSSGMIQSFKAGNWTNNHDTLYLSYVDETQKATLEQKVYIDRKTSTLIFNGDTSAVYARLRIMYNGL